MPKLPPVEKFPLSVRKNLRDEWDAKKGDIESKLSEIMGTPWTAEVDLHQVYAYAEEGYAKDNYGTYLVDYFESNLRRLTEFVEYFGEEVQEEINTICSAHILALDVDEENRFSYNGPDVLEGKLRMLFEPKMISTNIANALDQDPLIKALNDAPAGDDKALSFRARLYKRRVYDKKVEDVRSKIGEALNNPDIKFNPNFEENFQKLKEESKAKKTSLDRDWEANFSSITLAYYKGLSSQIGWQGFEDDDMLQEGFNETVSKGEITLRIVDKLKKGNYGEFEFEDGVFYMQTTTKTWGSNCDYICEKIVDAL